MMTFVPNFEKREGGLVPVVVQDAETREVLMLAYANCEAYVNTLKTRKATYYSTSRKELWVKGETSGNTQEVVDVLIDCDGDALVYIVKQSGGACHTNARSCFFRSCIDAKQCMDAPQMGEKDILPVAEAEDLLISPAPVLQSGSDPLTCLLPSGSLSKRVIELLATVGYVLREPDRTGYCGTVNGIAFHVRDRRMVPRLIGTRFDAGITGKDLVWAADCEGALRVIADLCFSRASDAPVRWVLAAPGGVLAQGSQRIGCELPILAKKILPSSLDYEIVEIEGSEEMAIADGLCDAVLVLTETGSSLRANGLEIVEGFEELLVSVPQILAMPELDVQKQRSLAELSAALRSAVGSSHRVMVTCDVLVASLDQLDLPSAVSPTVMPLRDTQWAAVQVCIQRDELGSVLQKLESSGARSIVVQRIEGYLS